MGKVVVAIPTFCRPTSLERLLRATEELVTPADVHVLVADNDAERREGAAVCTRLSNSYRWPLTSMIVAERGIAQVRNALVAQALKLGAEHVAMLDDDEWPDRDWLEELLRMQRETSTDAVQGSVLFCGDLKNRALARSEGIASIRHASGPVDKLEGAGNLLITRSCLEALEAPWFDPEFALTGGEDQEFFVRLLYLGKRFAWADDAIAYGDLEPQRLTLNWALMRAFSTGNSDMRVAMKYWSTGRIHAREWLKIAGAVALSPLMLVAFAPFASRRLDGPRLLFRAMGKASAILGLRHQRYLHGS